MGETIRIQPLSSALGAEVLGFDYKRHGGAAKYITAAWLESKVLVFRDQPTDPKALISIARMFGTPVRQPLQRPEYQVEGFPELRMLSSLHTDTLGDKKPLRIGGSWHTDHSHFPVPPKATILQAVKVPASGGDTCFSNNQAAYEELDEHRKRRVGALTARHVYNSKYTPRRMPAINPDEGKKQPQALHVIGREHPDTGERSIYLNPVRVDGIVGMPDEEAMQFVNELVEHATQEHLVYRHRWKVGDILIWDNRQVLHMVHHDYDPKVERLMIRTMIEGP